MNRSRQHGATLVIGLIFLVALSLFAVSAFRGSQVNLQMTGNIQARQEAGSAAQAAIEQVISSTDFIYTPDVIAATPVLVDVDNDGTNDYTVALSPAPRCFRSRPMNSADLNPDNAEDLACMSSSVSNTAGLETASGAGGAALSMCANSEWNVRAVATDARAGRTGARVIHNQGISIRIFDADAANFCN
jgi:hypothetical protein